MQRCKPPGVYLSFHCSVINIPRPNSRFLRFISEHLMPLFTLVSSNLCSCNSWVHIDASRGKSGWWQCLSGLLCACGGISASLFPFLQLQYCSLVLSKELAQDQERGHNLYNSWERSPSTGQLNNDLNLSVYIMNPTNWTSLAPRCKYTFLMLSCSYTPIFLSTSSIFLQ